MSEAEKPDILVADDELHIRTIIKTAVSSLGALVITASNGEDAIDKFKKKKPELVLLDINMPIYTGDEVLEVVLNDAPETCVVMLTSLADMKTVKKCLTRGASAYVLKDNPVRKIRSLIEEAWISHTAKKGTTND